MGRSGGVPFGTGNNKNNGQHVDLYAECPGEVVTGTVTNTSARTVPALPKWLTTTTGKHTRDTYTGRRLLTLGAGLLPSESLLAN